MIGNLAYNNYHGMQAQVTLRPTHGFSLVGTYTWSRNLGLLASGYTNPLDRAADYSLVNGHRSHQLVTYGTFDLPFGPGPVAVQGRQSGCGCLHRRLADDVDLQLCQWKPEQHHGIHQSLYSNAIPDFVGPEGSFDNKMGHVERGSPARTRELLRQPVREDQGSAMRESTTAQACRMSARCRHWRLHPMTSVIVFQNAAPGTRGNFGRMNVTNLGRWTLDAAMGKPFRVSESKSFTVRVDATNIFNHPMPSLGYTTVSSRSAIAANPDMTLSGTNDFGLLDNKVGTRTFQAKLRFDF